MITDADLQYWTEKIVEQFHPLRVILFGSYAYGHPHEDSDIDLLLVMPHEEKAFKVAAKIRLALLKIQQQIIGIDILVRSPEELESRLETEDLFFQHVLEKGHVLYATE